MEVLEYITKIIWQDNLNIIIEYVSIIDLIKDEREKHKYIYKVFSCNNTNYSIFFSRYKYLFNINLNHFIVLLILVLIRKMINDKTIYDK